MKNMRVRKYTDFDWRIEELLKEYLKNIIHRSLFKTPEEVNKEIAERNVTITKNNIEQEKMNLLNFRGGGTR